MSNSDFNELLQQVSLHMGQNDNASAISMLKNITVKYPENFRGFASLGLCYMREKKYEESIPSLAKAVELGNHYYSRHLLGQAQLYTKKFENAENTFKDCIEVGDEPVRAKVWLARTYLDANMLEEARQTIYDITATNLNWQLPKEKSIGFCHYPYFLQWVDTWEKYLKNQRIERVLEIGSMEGLSSLWMADKLVTQGSHIFCNDIVFRDEFRQNVAQSGLAEKFVLLEGSSEFVLPSLEDEYFNFAYVDGDHRPGAAFQDGFNAIQKVKTGSLIIFDDYLNTNNDTKRAVDLLCDLMRDSIEIIEKSRQVIMRKQAHTLDFHLDESLLEKYNINKTKWNKNMDTPKEKIDFLSHKGRYIFN